MDLMCAAKLYVYFVALCFLHFMALGRVQTENGASRISSTECDEKYSGIIYQKSDDFTWHYIKADMLNILCMHLQYYTFLSIASYNALHTAVARSL